MNKGLLNIEIVVLITSVVTSHFICLDVWNRFKTSSSHLYCAQSRYLLASGRSRYCSRSIFESWPIRNWNRVIDSAIKCAFRYWWKSDACKRFVIGRACDEWNLRSFCVNRSNTLNIVNLNWYFYVILDYLYLCLICSRMETNDYTQMDIHWNKNIIRGQKACSLFRNNHIWQSGKYQNIDAAMCENPGTWK